MEMDDVVFVTQDRKGLDYEKGDKYGCRNVPCGRRCWEKSSAKFYLEGLHASCPVTNFMEMDDVVFVTQDRKGLDYEKGDKYG